MPAAAEEIDFNENLRANYAKSCKLLGVKEDAKVTAAINPEADAAAPIVVIATDSQLGPPGVRALAAAILARGQGFKAPGYKHVKALRLWRADARDSGAAAVADVLKNGPHDKVELELVELMDSGITPAGCAALGSALVLGANASLRTLRLDMNGALRDEGVEALCRGLRSNRSLRVLTLAHCGLTERAAAVLATQWMASPLCVAEAFDLTGNKLGARGVQTLARAAATSKTLKELVLCDNQIGGGFLEARAGMARAGGAAADPEGADQAARAAAAVAEGIETTAAATKEALTALGEALASADCALARVSLEMNALTPADAAVLVPFCGPENKKIEMLKVDATLPPATFVALWRLPPPVKAKKGKKK